MQDLTPISAGETMTERTEFGEHYLVDLHGCDVEKISTVEPAREALLSAANGCGATVVGDRFHQFEPVGVSGVVLIAESHFSIHTWPEDGFVAVDIFTCGEMDAQKAIDLVAAGVGATRVESRIISRGTIGAG
jgi:S-adenosylmethionine decarboxylase